ncbi:MAG: twin-arginine translocase TatA/TatE family subunit [Gemmatimonadota bacterium]
MGGLGIWEIILILAVLLLLFGARRLPEIGASLGKGIREFKGSVKEIQNDVTPELRPGDNSAGDEAVEQSQADTERGSSA